MFLRDLPKGISRDTQGTATSDLTREKADAEPIDEIAALPPAEKDQVEMTVTSAFEESPELPTGINAESAPIITANTKLQGLTELHEFEVAAKSGHYYHERINKKAKEV